MKRVLLLVSVMMAQALSQAPDEYNVPDFIRECWKRGGIEKKYVLSARINPFYLRGDFNADGHTDYAVLITEEKTGKRGIAICHGKAGSVAIIGAGTSFLRSDGFDYQDFSFEAWLVYEKNSVDQSLHEEGPPPKLLGEAILVEWPERGSGIVFWNGKKYAWYQLGG